VVPGQAGWAAFAPADASGRGLRYAAGLLGAPVGATKTLILVGRSRTSQGFPA